MMYYRQVKSAVAALLSDAALGRFRVIGYQDHGKAAEEVLETDRSVNVWVSEGNFLKKSSSHYGPVNHRFEVKVGLTVAASASLDVATLTSESATSAQRQTAISAKESAAKQADDSFDELLDLVWNILMDNESTVLELEDIDAPVDRWVDSWKKSEPISVGEYVAITGLLTLEMQIREEITGATPVAASVDGIIDLTLKTGADDAAGIIAGD
jgi:hypothetical protein